MHTAQAGLMEQVERGLSIHCLYPYFDEIAAELEKRHQSIAMTANSRRQSWHGM